MNQQMKQNKKFGYISKHLYSRIFEKVEYIKTPLTEEEINFLNIFKIKYVKEDDGTFLVDTREIIKVVYG